MASNIAEISRIPTFDPNPIQLVLDTMAEVAL